MWPESSSASRHDGEAIARSLASQRRVSIFEMRQRRPETGLIEHREPPRARPQHQAGTAVGAIE